MPLCHLACQLHIQGYLNPESIAIQLPNPNEQ
jgi:hypothetical protein